MDSDRTIQKFDCYSAEYWATVRMTIRARDMTLAVERFNSLFTEGGRKYLDGNAFEDIQSIVHRDYDRIHGEKRYLFEVLISVRIGCEGEPDDDTEEEARDLLMESLDNEHPDWLTDIGIIDMELEDSEFTGEDYRD